MHDIFDFNKPFDYNEMMMTIEKMTKKYDFLSFTSIGQTMLGKCIPMLSLGEGEKEILYIAAHKATDWQDSLCLMKFLCELCDFVKRKSKIYFYDSEYLYKTRTIHIVPMLNPDGVDYNINGISEENPLYERVMAMNDQSSDFSLWESNARGVSLDKNYIIERYSKNETEDNTEYSFSSKPEREGEWAESELEVGSVCNLLRYNVNIKLIASIYSNAEMELCVVNSSSQLSEKKAKISQLFKRDTQSTNYETGIKLKLGLSNWCDVNLSTSVVSVLNKVSSRDCFYKYIRLREGLFSLPMLI